MACGNCVFDLARRLVKHHKIDWIFALESAEKGVERVENREPDILAGVEGLDDYTQACLPSSPTVVACPEASIRCFTGTDCAELTQTCSSASCPAPLPNSHYVSNNCTKVVYVTCQECISRRCKTTGTYKCAGTCGYDCTPPYVWNPITLQCEIPPIPAKPLINKPLVNPTLINPPLIRWLEKKGIFL